MTLRNRLSWIKGGIPKTMTLCLIKKCNRGAAKMLYQKRVLLKGSQNNIQNKKSNVMCFHLIKRLTIFRNYSSWTITIIIQSMRYCLKYNISIQFHYFSLIRKLLFRVPLFKGINFQINKKLKLKKKQNHSWLSIRALIKSKLGLKIVTLEE